jgi:glycosyltransferase involved in cell wall biosynthesis
MHVVSVSYVKPVKRVLLIARMLQEYAEKNPNNIISWTHFGDGEQYEELKTITNSMAIKVKLQGMRSNAEVLEFYQENHVDLFVNLSISEGVPVSIMEAISFGIPVLATDSGGTKEIVTKNVGSLIKVDFTYPEFSKALKESRAKLRREVLEYSRLNYCSSTNYPDFIKRLHELCF